jgi:nucleoside 2-deoxyribosyltransferase
MKGAAMTKVYISGPLTNTNDIESLKGFYESIGAECNRRGLTSYIPHLNTDPISHANITPRQVFETDKYHVRTSDLIIAYIGHPSIGVGMELAYSEINEIPIILLYENNIPVSRFPRGIPNIIKEISFNSYQEGLDKLKSFLEDYIKA